jgi:hypothetical protein
VLLKLLTLPISAPAAGIRFCLMKVAEIADAEMNSEEPVKEELLQLQLDLEEGRVDEKTYVVRERVLLARLRELREAARERLREELDEMADEAESKGRRIFIDMPDELR